MSKEQTDLLPEGYAETMPANWADVLRSRAEATYLDDTKGTRDLLTATAIYLSAASPSPAGGVQGVRVKPLVWIHTGNADVGGTECDEAEMPFGGYVITADHFSYSPTTAYYVDGPNWFNGQFASVDEAKAAAQSDYEARILSALSSQAQTTGGEVDQFIAAAKLLEDAGWKITRPALKSGAPDA